MRASSSPRTRHRSTPEVARQPCAARESLFPTRSHSGSRE
ncbi:hypothetical protein GEV26_17295 [Aeromicrobium yanjiei]|uniref:Uncharacterized protein n=1 Tax=Aeromicrobium yanjiei TaxID=2662028 RepID=A0A5Q2MJM3_9ACTN|nr:hypothetical protein GEV26_17295 [Aeromicrobium yanjiei]